MLFYSFKIENLPGKRDISPSLANNRTGIVTWDSIPLIKIENFEKSLIDVNVAMREIS